MSEKSFPQSASPTLRYILPSFGCRSSLRRSHSDKISHKLRLAAQVEDIKKYAREVRKMRTLRESALQLVEQGVTTPEEMMKISYEV